MPLPATYRTGTVTVAAGGTSVTGIGTNFLAFGIRAGDILSLKGLTVSIASVQSATALTLMDPWPGAAQTSQPYEIRYLGDPSRVLSATHAAIATFESGGGTGGGPVPWTEVTDKPATFPPSGHTHPWGQVTNKPLSYPPSTHRHNASDIDGLTATAWADITDKPPTYPPSAHTHVAAQIDDLGELLAFKADADHRHDASEIDNLPDAGDALTAPSLPALMASSTVYAVGSVILTRAEAQSYQVVASAPQMTTTGGIGLVERGPQFSTRARLGDAVTRGLLPQGAAVTVGGVGYVVDSSATGMASALWDIGVSGVVSPDRPQNAYVSAFHDLNSPRVIRLYSSVDGLSWRLLNALPLQSSGGEINGGNPVVCYRGGWFYILTEFSSVTNYDFVIYKTRDFGSFQRFNCKANGTVTLMSNTVPAPGASVPADAIWGADMAFTPEGELHVFITVPFAAPTTDIYGNPVGDRRTYRTRCTNLDTLTFSNPTLVLPGGDSWSMIDASVTRTPAGWLFSVKDELKKTIRIYTGPAITGPWTFQEEVGNTTYKIEGSSIVPRRSASGAVNWDLYVEGHDTIAENVRSTRMMVHRGGTQTLGWNAIQPTFMQSTRGIRHGTPLNLGFEDPAAAAAFQAFAAMTGDGIQTSETWLELAAGARTIVPQEGVIYYVASDSVTNLTILDGPAQRFALAALTSVVTAGINVLAAGKVIGATSIGFGCDHDRLVWFHRRDETGRYHPEAGAGRALFSAHKNGVDQAVSVTTAVPVTFGTTTVSAGGVFSGSAWTPPAGRYVIQAGVLFSGAVAGQSNRLQLRRNGVVLRQVIALSQTGSNSLFLSCIVTANGSDTFTAEVEFPGAGTKTISGAASNTWFEGTPA